MIVEVFENQPDIPIEKLVCFFLLLYLDMLLTYTTNNNIIKFN